ncbi:unnamed protein product, partial [marine sediment metagenome]
LRILAGMGTILGIYYNLANSVATSFGGDHLPFSSFL